ncbi:ABC transporter permease [Clostridium saudiense]|uniref:ABC transporter permease n=2 Tax=Clostridium TaxID=1485 RepID=A0ABS2FBM5_9CLOT|nr:ABC transporter permease [Clostridium saudiense]MBM6817930.1 ABC transporter permease [Clostridium saudiense]
MKSYSDITLKYLKENKKRTLFTIIGIILSLSLISGVGFLGLSVRDLLYDNAIKNSGDYEFGFWNVDKKVISILRNDVDLDKVGVITNADSGSYKLGGFEDCTIYITSEDEVCLKDIFKTELTEGRLPENGSELIISDEAKEYLKLELNDKITLNEINYKNEKEIKVGVKEFTIVGFTKESFPSDGTWLNGITFLEKIENNKTYDIKFTVKDNKNKYQTVLSKAKRLNIEEELIDSNNDLLALRGQSEYKGINDVIKGISIFVIIIIMITTIFLIYNTINISITERMAEFGILRSIGATPKQIRNLVIKESLILCLISIPFGVLSGFIGVWITVKLLESNISMMFNDSILTVKFYPSIILFTLIIGVITIFIASFGPARKAGKVSPISIIKGSSGGSIKYYNGKIVRKIFGVEGWVAYKNIRKNSKRFIVTILSLSISLIMFILFTTLNMKRLDELAYINKSSLTHGNIYLRKDIVNEVSDKIKNINGIDEVYIQPYLWLEYLALDPALITDEFKSSYGYESDEFLNNITILGYDDNSLKELGVENGLKDGEVIIINSFARYNEDGKLENINISNLEEDDTFKIPVSNFSTLEENFLGLLIEDLNNDNCIEFKVKKILDKNPFESDYNYDFKIIMSKDFLEKINTSEYIRYELKFKYTNINDEKLTESASNEIQSIEEDYKLTLNDLNADNKMQQQMWTVINVFVYGFIVIISLIGIINVVNTISLNILLKKKEFGTLGTIGMSERQLSKMVILEGMLHGIIASIIGGIISLGLVLIAVKIINFGLTVSNKIYWQPFVIGFTINLLVVLIASLIPLNKLKKMSLVETIRNIE